MGVASHLHFGQGGGLATPKLVLGVAKTTSIWFGGGSATLKGKNLIFFFKSLIYIYIYGSHMSQF
jgi:hypothetical protein